MRTDSQTDRQTEGRADRHEDGNIAFHIIKGFEKMC